MYEQVKLNYSADALEPFIDAQTVETHYGRHHATYTKTLNDLAAKAGVSDLPIEELLRNLSRIEDPALRTAVRNNGGGFYNHNLYFSTLSPTPAAVPDGAFLENIEHTFGSLDALKAELKTAALGQFGSGWSFLSATEDGRLSVTKSPNQDNPLSEGSDATPILALDVWEHAYYLKYRNLRADYIDAFFHVLDWKAVQAGYARVTGSAG